MIKPSLLCAGLCAALLAACASAPQPAASRPSPPVAPVPVVVAERFVSDPVSGEELDSLTSWSHRADKREWVIASGKSTHRLTVFDAADGKLIRHVGGKGKRSGQFTRPNGLAVSGDLLFVVERDHPRVQVLRLPDFRHVLSFGAEQLRSPYGIWVHDATEPKATMQVYVTDSFMDGQNNDMVPPLAQLDQRVRRYRLSADGRGRLQAVYDGSFGTRDPVQALRMVESVVGDPTRDRMLIADESTVNADGSKRESTYRSYSLAGQAWEHGLPAGTFVGEAEGIALWECGANAGYWLAADQLSPHTVFHLFDRDSLALVGSFRGNVTSHTDGITIHRVSTERFPAGALYAVHDDKALAAFDLRDIARTFGLPQTCMQ